jgi:endogenous inhibitor of DNA gyrase (YacG/DUF329 family)
MRDRGQERTQPHRRWQYTCPICGRRVTVPRSRSSQLPAFFPFCSERCKLIDLGAWLDADYRIAGKTEESEHPPGRGPSGEAEGSEK